MRAALYARISITDTKVDKTANQLVELKALAAKEGYEVSGIYEEDGISAYSGKLRPAWEQLLKDTAAGKFDVILATEEERFARNATDKERLLVESAASNVIWHTIRDGKVDPKTAAGAFMSSIRGAFARMESDRKKERQQARYEHRIAEGMPLWGHRPFGYHLDRLTLDPAEAPLIESAYETVLNGGSLYSIAKAWNDANALTPFGKKWSATTVKQVLLRPRNAGLYESKRTIVDVEAKWTPIIDIDRWEATRAILSDPNRVTARGTKPRWLASQIAVCGVCGAYMRTAGSNTRGVKIALYRCSSKTRTEHEGYSDKRRHPACNAEQLDAEIARRIAQYFLTNRDNLEAKEEFTGLSSISTKLGTIATTRANLIELVSDGSVSMQDIKSKLKELSKEEIALQAERDSILASSAHAAMLSETKALLFTPGVTDWDEAGEVFEGLLQQFKALPVETKRTLVRDILNITVNTGSGTNRFSITLRED